MGKFTNELDEILAKKDRVVAIAAIDLKNELEDNTPTDTGYLKGGWEKRKVEDGWEISNPVEYASFALAPYIQEGGISQGSQQFPAGIKPILDKFDRDLQEDLSKI